MKWKEKQVLTVVKEMGVNYTTLMPGEKLEVLTVVIHLYPVIDGTMDRILTLAKAKQAFGKTSYNLGDVVTSKIDDPAKQWDGPVLEKGREYKVTTINYVVRSLNPDNYAHFEIYEGKPSPSGYPMSKIEGYLRKRANPMFNEGDVLKLKTAVPPALRDGFFEVKSVSGGRYSLHMEEIIGFFDENDAPYLAVPKNIAKDDYVKIKSGPLAGCEIMVTGFDYDDDFHGLSDEPPDEGFPVFEGIVGDFDIQQSKAHNIFQVYRQARSTTRAVKTYETGDRLNFKPGANVPDGITGATYIIDSIMGNKYTITCDEAVVIDGKDLSFLRQQDDEIYLITKGAMTGKKLYLGMEDPEFPNTYIANVEDFVVDAKFIERNFNTRSIRSTGLEKKVRSKTRRAITDEFKVEYEFDIKGTVIPACLKQTPYFVERVDSNYVYFGSDDAISFERPDMSYLEKFSADKIGPNDSLKIVGGTFKGANLKILNEPSKNEVYGLVEGVKLTHKEARKIFLGETRSSGLEKKVRSKTRRAVQKRAVTNDSLSRILTAKGLKVWNVNVLRQTDESAVAIVKVDTEPHQQAVVKQVLMKHPFVTDVVIEDAPKTQVDYPYMVTVDLAKLGARNRTTRVLPEEFKIGQELRFKNTVQPPALRGVEAVISQEHERSHANWRVYLINIPGEVIFASHEDEGYVEPFKLGYIRIKKGILANVPFRITHSEGEPETEYEEGWWEYITELGGEFTMNAGDIKKYFDIIG